MIIAHPPEFKTRNKDLPRYEKRKLLSDSINRFINRNFNKEIAEHLNLKGKQSIFTQFKINEQGCFEDIKVRSSTHPDIEEEVIRVIKLLPQFKPAQQQRRNIASVFSLPITFILED